MKDLSWLLYCGLWPIFKMALESLTSSVPPLFAKDSDIGTLGGTSISPYDMCSAITRTTGLTKLVGVQKISNLWRICLADATTRLEMFVKKHILINGKDLPATDARGKKTNSPEQ